MSPEQAPAPYLPATDLPATDLPATDLPATYLPATYLRGARLGWADAPAELHTWVSEQLGGPVALRRDCAGGMSVGVAAVLQADDREVFVKAVDGAHNPKGFDLYRQEAAFAPRLPATPLIPALLAAGALTTDAGPWAVLVYEAAGGAAVDHPWSGDALTRVLDAWAELAPLLHADTDPAPSAELSGFLGRWRTVVDDPTDPWHDLLHGGAPGRRWSDRLAVLAEHVDGTTTRPAVLSHIDLRADNILLGAPTATNPYGVWFADWAHPSLAAPWADPAILFGDVIGSGADRPDGGGVDVIDVWRTHPATAAYDVERLITTVVALAAAVHVGSRRPPSPLFAHQRGWERALADGLRGFVERHRT